MALNKPIPKAKVIRQLLDYDKISGAFTWKERALSFFPDARAWKIWNTRFAGKPALCTLAHNGYLYGAIFGENFSAHRIAWVHATGKEPKEIDHINGNRADNRLANLRAVTRTQNCQNVAISSRNSSGFVGVSWSKVMKSWHVRIGGETIGYFSKFEDAVAARKIAEANKGFHPNHGRAAALA